MLLGERQQARDLLAIGPRDGAINLVHGVRFDEGFRLLQPPEVVRQFASKRLVIIEKAVHIEAVRHVVFEHFVQLQPVLSGPHNDYVFHAVPLPPIDLYNHPHHHAPQRKSDQQRTVKDDQKARRSVPDPHENEACGEHDHLKRNQHERPFDDVVQEDHREVHPDGNEVEGEEVTEVQQQDDFLEAVTDKSRVISAERTI